MALGREAYDGLAQLSHAIRRSMAAYVAMSVTEPGSSIEEMLANADIVAQWIGGSALSKQDSSTPPGPPLGQPWPPVGDD